MSPSEFQGHLGAGSDQAGQRLPVKGPRVKSEALGAGRLCWESSQRQCVETGVRLYGQSLAPRVSRPGLREGKGPWLVLKAGRCVRGEPMPGSPVHPQEKPFGSLTPPTLLPHL